MLDAEAEAAQIRSWIECRRMKPGCARWRGCGRVASALLMRRGAFWREALATALAGDAPQRAPE